MRVAANRFQKPSLAETNPENWRAALEIVMDNRPRGEKFVLALDEFQWIAESAEELPSLLQEFLDMQWKEAGDVMLVVCGSYIGFMESEVLGSKSPLFGRRTGQILLKPFSYKESTKFHPGWGIEDQAKAWFICGGIPFYHGFFTGSRSLMANIEANFLREESALFGEAEFLLREELKEVRRYFAILTALGTGSLTGKELEKATGIVERKLAYYSKRLEGLRYTSKRTPLTPDPKGGGNRARYCIDDALLMFWFRFVQPNTGFIAEMGSEETFRSVVAPHLDAWFGKRFEALCRESLPGIYRQEGINVPFRVGEYWGPKVQIDVVGIREKDGIDLCECKWGNVASRRIVYEAIQGKAHLYPAGQWTVQPRVFTRSIVTGDRKKDGVLWFSLADLSN